MKEIFSTSKILNASLARYLTEIGALYVDETGIHANEPGIYPKKQEIPTQTANPSGDE